MQSPLYIDNFAWSIDGRSLALSITQLDGFPELYVVSGDQVRGFGPAETWNQYWGSTATWHPTGDRLLVPEGREDGAAMLVEIQLAPRTQTPLVPASAAVWDPDGSQLALIELEAGACVVRLAGPHGTGPRPRARFSVGSGDTGSGPLGAPLWSPDGQWLAVPFERRIALVGMSEAADVLVREGGVAPLEWLPDSSGLLGVADGALVVVAPRGAPRRILGPRAGCRVESASSSMRSGLAVIEVCDSGFGQLRVLPASDPALSTLGR